MRNRRETEVVICSNMLNEIDMLQGKTDHCVNIGDWYENFSQLADGGMIIVDGGSTDGTLEYFRRLGASFIVSQADYEKYRELTHIESNRLLGTNANLVIVIDNIIQREGYGPARNHLRAMAKQYFPEAHWCAYFDADERIAEEEMHMFRHIKDSLIDEYDIIAFPRIDWKPDGMPAKSWEIQPDYQARMSRIHRPIVYMRKLHEQVSGHRMIYANIETPKINHYHRSATQEKRDYVGKVCAYLHNKDTEHGHTYPEHHKEAHYRKRVAEEGL